MEAFAGFYITDALGSPSPTSVFPRLSFWQEWQGKRLSSLARRCFLTIAMTLGLLLVSVQAIAATLHPGDRGPAVKLLQQRLAEAGLSPGHIDGVYGKRTLEAVRKFQSQQGLEADGIAGSQTLAALTRQPQRTSSDRRLSTQELQQLLADKGFYQGSIDGIYGSQTHAAVMAAQQSYGLTPDGKAGPMTLAALRGETPGRSLQSSDSSNKIRDLQQLLQQRSFYSGPLDGLPGPQTNAAIRAAQQAYGLIPDGIAGSSTWAALHNSARPTLSTPQRTNVPDPAVRRLPVPALPTSSQNVNSRQPVPGPPPPVGPNTPTTFRAGGPSIPDLPGLNLREPRTSAQTLALQQMLRDRGFYTGPIDGIFSSETRLAIFKAQTYYGVIPTTTVPTLVSPR